MSIVFFPQTKARQDEIAALLKSFRDVAKWTVETAKARDEGDAAKSPKQDIAI